MTQPRHTTQRPSIRPLRGAAVLSPLALAACLASLPAQAADRYWSFIGGCGTADWISTTAGANAQGRFNCWSNTLGGLSGQTFPTASDDVFVLAPGAASTLLVNVASASRPAFTASARDVTLYGNGSFAAGLAIDRYSTAVRNLTLGAEGLDFLGRVDQSGGSVTVGAFLAVAAGEYNLSGGSLNAGMLFVDSQQAAARYTQTGGTLISSAIDLRSSFGRDASFSVLAGTVSSNTLTLGAASSSGRSAATVSGFGTSWSNSGTTIVGALSAGTLDITDRAQVFTGSAVIGNTPGGNSSVTVADLATLWKVGGLLTVGNAGSGVLTVRDGARVEAGSVVLNGTLGNGATATVVGQRSLLTANTLVVGRDAVLDIAGGAGVNSTFGVIGDAAGFGGTVRVIGSGTRWTSATSLFVGELGIGRIEVLDNAQLQSTNASVGWNAGSSGSVLLTGSGTHWQATDSAGTSGALVVGEGGSGSVVLTNGASLTTRSTSVGTARDAAAIQSFGVGSVTLEGTGSLWQTDTLSVGSRGNGNGSFSVGSGARLAAGSVTLGVAPTAVGVLGASGAGSRIDIDTDLQIGIGGSATLTLADGAALTSGTTRIGDVGDANGAVRLDGIGTTWTSAQPLVVGRYARGDLTVASGAAVDVATLALGQQNQGRAGTGSVTVTGAGSRLSVVGAINVGDGGAGTLTVDGGVVESGARTQAGAFGRVVISNGGTLRSDSVWLADPARLDWRNGVLHITGKEGLALDNLQLPSLLQLLPGRTLQVDNRLRLDADSQLLLSGGALRVGTLTLDQGVLASTGGGAYALQMDGIGLLAAQGQIGARIVGGIGATNAIVATGPLTLGLLSHGDGFAFGGRLDTGGHQVVLLDRDLAGLGAMTQLRDGAQLVTVNGAQLDAGTVLEASGATSVQGRFVNNGLVQSGASPLTFIGGVSGSGEFRGNVRFLAGYAPGNGTAQVGFGGAGVAFGEHAVLTLELNGTAAGSGFDQLVDIGTLSFDGMLVLDFGAGFTAAPGTVLSLFDFDAFVGRLDAARVVVNGFEASNLDLSRLGSDGTLTVTAVPEPGALALWLAGLGAIGLRLRRMNAGARQRSGKTLR